MIALTGKKYVEKLVQMSDALNCHFSFRMNNEIMAIPEELEKRGFFSLQELFDVGFLKVQQVRDLLVLINGLFKESTCPLVLGFLWGFLLSACKKWNNNGLLSVLYKPKFLSFYLLVLIENLQAPISTLLQKTFCHLKKKNDVSM